MKTPTKNSRHRPFFTDLTDEKVFKIQRRHKYLTHSGINIVRGETEGCYLSPQDWISGESDEFKLRLYTRNRGKEAAEKPEVKSLPGRTFFIVKSYFSDPNITKPVFLGLVLTCRIFLCPSAFKDLCSFIVTHLLRTAHGWVLRFPLL